MKSFMRICILGIMLSLVFFTLNCKVKQPEQHIDYLALEQKSKMLEGWEDSLSLVHDEIASEKLYLEKKEYVSYEKYNYAKNSIEKEKAAIYKKQQELLKKSEELNQFESKSQDTKPEPKEVTTIEVKEKVASHAIITQYCPDTLIQFLTQRFSIGLVLDEINVEEMTVEVSESVIILDGKYSGIVVKNNVRKIKIPAGAKYVKAFVQCTNKKIAISELSASTSLKNLDANLICNWEYNIYSESIGDHPIQASIVWYSENDEKSYISEKRIVDKQITIIPVPLVQRLRHSIPNFTYETIIAGMGGLVALFGSIITSLIKKKFKV